VAVPGDLPRLHERVAEVLRDVAPEVQRQRPVHRDGEHDGHGQNVQKLAPRGSAFRPDAPGHPRIIHCAPPAGGAHTRRSRNAALALRGQIGLGPPGIPMRWVG